MRGFYKQDTLPMCTSVLPLLPAMGEPNNLSYDHEQAKQESCKVQSQGSHHVILSFQAFTSQTILSPVV